MADGPGFLGTWGHRVHSTGAPYEDQVNQTGQPAFPHTKYCVDVVGEHFNPFGAEMDHDLFLDSFQGDSFPSMNYLLWDGSSSIDERLIGWVPADLLDMMQAMARGDPYIGEPSWPDHLDLSSLLVPVNALLAKTNPSTPSTDIPSFLWETLRDLPSLIYMNGRSILSPIADLNLKWEFGWKPLMSDVRNMIDFGTRASRKLAMIEKLIKGSYKTTRTIEIHSEASTEQFSWDLTGIPGDISEPLLVNVTRSTAMRRWGCVTYSLTAEARERFSRYSTEEKVWKSIQAEFGLHWRNPAALWEVLPWSWLIDWFIPITDILQQYNNVIPVEPLNVCVMTETATTFSFEQEPHSKFVVALPDILQRITKERVVLSPEGYLPAIPPGRPIVDARKLGILASIGILRGSPRGVALASRGN